MLVKVAEVVNKAITAQIIPGKITFFDTVFTQTGIESLGRCEYKIIPEAKRANPPVALPKTVNFFARLQVNKPLIKQGQRPR